MVRGVRGAAPPAALKARGELVRSAATANPRRREVLASVGAKRRLDTLAQLDQRPGTDDKQKLVNRARAKYLTYPLAIQLAELHSPLEKSYRNAVYCAADLEQDEYGKIRGHYCNTRWCLVCNRVRLARSINRYLAPIGEWKDPQLVTLTLPNVPAAALKKTIGTMMGDVESIRRAMKRTDKVPFRALRKLECTYNIRRDDYHPHFHFVVEGATAATTLLRRWLALHPDATAMAQDIRPCDAGSLMEVFKYFTKLVVKCTDDARSRVVAPVAALDVIFQAMHGRRVFQTLGFTVAAAPENDENADIGTSGDTAAVKRIGDRLHWEWIQQSHDWVDLASGEVLTGYHPNEQLRQLVERSFPGTQRASDRPGAPSTSAASASYTAPSSTEDRWRWSPLHQPKYSAGDCTDGTFATDSFAATVPIAEANAVKSSNQRESGLKDCISMTAVRA